MRSGLILGIVAVAAWTVTANAQDFRAADFRAHRAAAVKAVNAGDFHTAESEISAARAMLPSAPSVLLLGAQIEVAAGKPEAAKSWIDDYVGRGLWFDSTRYPALASLLDEAGKARLTANGSDFGTFTTVATISDLNLVEGIAIAGRDTFVSSVHKGALNRLDTNILDPICSLPAGQGGYGLAMRNHMAWMATSPDDISGQGAPSQRPAVIQIDTTSGIVLQRFEAPPEIQSLGDIALGTTDLYASDGKSGAVLRLQNLKGAWQTLIPGGRLGSPQGLIENADGSAVIVADYTSGLYRIDTKTGGATQIPVPDDTSLVGIDGVTRYKDGLIVVQNGIQPARILRIHMSKDWHTIISTDILLRRGSLDEPTGGQVVDDRYAFVARSQWSDFTDDGTPKPTHGPAVIGEIPLAH